MIIIISPTKTMKRKNYIEKSHDSVPFPKESDVIRSHLKTLDKSGIKSLYKVSDKLVDTVYDYFKSEGDSSSAINLYDGISFQYMNIDEYNDSELDFLSNHLRILSAMYGVLEVKSPIVEYRLDYMIKYKFNLYDYWKKPLEEYFKDVDVIVNLASVEYSKSIPTDNMVNIFFMNQDYKSQSTASKMARGDMIHYIVKRKIEDVELLKEYDQLEYTFDEEKSDAHNYYFIKG